MKKTADFRAGKLLGTFLYFSCKDYNGLYKYDMNRRKAAFLTFFPEEEILQKDLHGKVLVYGKKLFFVPGVGGKKLHVYDYESGEICSISLLERRGWEGDAFIINKTLWMIPFKPQNYPVMKMNVDSLKPDGIPHFFDGLPGGYCPDKQQMLMRRLFTDGESVWFAIWHSDQIVRIFFKDYKKVLYPVELKDLYGIFMACGEIWLTTYLDRHIYKWSPKRGVYQKCEMQGAYEKKVPSSHIFALNRTVFALPFKSEFITKYNQHTGNFELLQKYPSDFYFTDTEGIKFSYYDRYGNLAACFPYNSEDILLINGDTGELSGFAPSADMDEELLRSMNLALIREGTVRENRSVKLLDYVGMVGGSGGEGRLRNRNEIGDIIWNQC